MFKINKKKVLLSISFVLAIVLSYWYGSIVGQQQAFINVRAAEAFRLVTELQMYSGDDPEIRDEREAKINKLIIEIGSGLESELPLMPGFDSIKEINLKLIETVVKYRKSNPRIVNGIKYDPLKEGWREYLMSEEFKSSGEYLDEEMYESSIQKAISMSEEKIRQYKLVMAIIP